MFKQFDKYLSINDVKYLEIYCSQCQTSSYNINYLPNSIIGINIYNRFSDKNINSYNYDKLPITLQKLNCCFIHYNKLNNLCNLPPLLQTLRTNLIDVNYDNLPNTLTHLQIQYAGNKISCNKLPNNIQFLYLDVLKYNKFKIFETFKLPKTLKCLVLNLNCDKMLAKIYNVTSKSNIDLYLIN